MLPPLSICVTVLGQAQNKLFHSPLLTHHTVALPVLLALYFLQTRSKPLFLPFKVVLDLKDSLYSSPKLPQCFASLLLDWFYLEVPPHLISNT